MAAWNAVGSWMDGSGWTNAHIPAEIATFKLKFLHQVKLNQIFVQLI